MPAIKHMDTTGAAELMARARNPIVQMICMCSNNTPTTCAMYCSAWRWRAIARAAPGCAEEMVDKFC